MNAHASAVFVVLSLSFLLGCVDESSSESDAAAAAPNIPVDAETASTAGDAEVPVSAAPELRVDTGALKGVWSADGSVRSFLGIPYAKPPLGDLRFKGPQAPEAWSGVRDASAFSGRCAQIESTTLMNKGSENEDCLYLNVWSKPSADKLPVMVWIHGGGNVNGSANEPVPYVNTGLFYDGEHLAKQDVVVVTFNYRLGVLGYLAHTGLMSEGEVMGNQGLWDQAFVLAWVKRNIAAFGGDPANVTIFGESAGSFDVCAHVASPASRGLFHAAISQSGGCTTFQPTTATALMTTDKLSSALGCAGDAGLACLRGKSVHDLLAAIPMVPSGNAFGPTVDGTFFPEQPRAIFDQGRAAKVPYILGSNSDEGTLFTAGLAGTLQSEDAYRAAVTARFPAVAEQVLQQYPLSDYADQPSPPLAAFARVLGDSSLVCTTWDAAQRAAAAGNAVHVYNFDIAANSGNLGATHGSELVYVFGTSSSLSMEQSRVATLMQSYWTNLAKRGDPNSDGLLPWPAFSKASDKRVNLSTSPSIVENFRSDKCTFWQTVYAARFAAAGAP
jgi:para-nitrobenzyl esterase